MRLFSVLLVVGGLGFSSMATASSAQVAGTGSVAGRVVVCKELQRPVGETGADLAADTQAMDKPDLSDVTPGGAFRNRVAPPITLPASNIQVTIAGTSITARTDADGRFVLGGVPAGAPVVVQADFSVVRPLAVQMSNVVVNAGQTLDLGTLALTGCGGTATGAEAPVVILEGDPGVVGERRIELFEPVDVQPETTDAEAN
jgi:hypothetical protein